MHIVNNCLLKLALLFAFWINFSCAFAQNNIYQFNSIDARKGLSNNQVNAIFKDERGFIWLGTTSGLNRYDGYNFKVFRRKPGDTTSIGDDYVSQIVKGPDQTLWILSPNGWNIFNPRTEKFTSNSLQVIQSLGIVDDGFSDIVEDKRSNFWFVYPRKGLYKYNSVTKKTSFFSPASKLLALSSSNVSRVAVDSKGYVWVIYTEGTLEKIDPVSDKVVFRTAVLRPYIKTTDIFYRIFIDRDDDLWIYTRAEARGVFYYRPPQNDLQIFQKETGAVRLNNNIVNGVTQDNKGLIWIATDHGGINLVNKKDFSVRYLTNDENDPKSLSQNSVNTIYTDDDGTIWIGTYKKGVSQFHENNARFPLYHHQSCNTQSLPYNDINKFLEDKAGNLWIGTNGGLIYFDRKAGTYKRYVHSDADPNSLSNNVIVSMHIDNEGKLWIGTYFGGMDCFDGKKFTHYRHDPKNPQSLADDRVWEIFEDSRHRFWIGTLTEGLELFDRKTGTFTHYGWGRANRSPASRYVCSIVEDKSGNIWMATSLGLEMLDVRTGAFQHFEHIENDPTSLSYNNVVDLLPDSRGLLWIATRNGLNVYSPSTKKFTSFYTTDGLPDNSIFTLLEDNNGSIWATTPNALARVIVSGTAAAPTFGFKSYNEADGLQSGQFNEHAALRLRSGELVVGGANGMNIFLPSGLSEKKPAPHLVITDLQIFNNSARIGEQYEGSVVLPQSITEAKEITLEYDQNVFTVEFAAIDFLAQDKIKYAYKLEGFNTEWLTTITIYELGPNSYIVTHASHSINSVFIPPHQNWPSSAKTTYTDLACWYSSNEIAINWNAPIAYLANAMEALKEKVGYVKD